MLFIHQEFLNQVLDDVFQDIQQELDNLLTVEKIGSAWLVFCFRKGLRTGSWTKNGTFCAIHKKTVSQLRDGTKVQHYFDSAINHILSCIIFYIILILRLLSSCRGGIRNTEHFYIEDQCVISFDRSAFSWSFSICQVSRYVNGALIALFK
jgi:hypothetical protein